MELFDGYVRDWALAQRWLWRQHQISCCIEAGDLAQDPTPKAQWVIGIHPEVTKGGPWFRCWAVRCWERMKFEEPHFIRVLKVHFILGLLAVSLRLLHSLNTPGGFVT